MQPAPGDRLATYGQMIVEVRRPEGVSFCVRSTLDVDERAWPWPTEEPVHILTAWDPGSERPGLERNRLRQAALEAELRLLGLRLASAIGVDPVTGRREEGMAVVGASESTILALGARYDQDAVFAWTPAAWAVVACRDGARLVSGWSLSPASSPGI